jgi:hypothetical protein
VAALRPRCLYCGAPLSAGAQAAAAASARAALGAEAPAATSRRVLLLVDVSGADPERLAAALGISPYEGRQRLARGGVQLHRVLLPEDLETEARRLDGLTLVRIPETALSPTLRPWKARGGRFADGRLALRGEDGSLELATQDVLGLVRGPIAREYAAQDAARRKYISTATLEPGYRLHLHRAQGPTVELDPWAFDFADREAARSSLLTLGEWMQELCAGRPQDDGFRFEPPALAPVEEAPDDTGKALGRAERPKDARAILDNLRQFRFYSGWRGALLRR